MTPAWIACTPWTLRHPALALAVALLAALTLLPGLRAADVSFADLQARVSRRCPTTHAILQVDGGRRFSLAIANEQATVHIWTHMMVKDEHEEIYTFPLNDDIRAEHARLTLRAELDVLAAKSVDLERRYRVGLFRDRGVALGMSPTELQTALGKPLLPGQPSQALGIFYYRMDAYSFTFHTSGLYDITWEGTPQPLTAAEAKATP